MAPTIASSELILMVVFTHPRKGKQNTDEPRIKCTPAKSIFNEVLTDLHVEENVKCSRSLMFDLDTM